MKTIAISVDDETYRHCQKMSGCRGESRWRSGPARGWPICYPGLISDAEAESRRQQMYDLLAPH